MGNLSRILIPILFGRRTADEAEQTRRPKRLIRLAESSAADHGVRRYASVRIRFVSTSDSPAASRQAADRLAKLVGKQSFLPSELAMIAFRTNILLPCPSDGERPGSIICIAMPNMEHLTHGVSHIAAIPKMLW